MERAGHLSYLILLAYLSIIDQSKAKCQNGLEDGFLKEHLKQHIPLVIVGNLTTSMCCTMKNYSDSETWKRHSQNKTEWYKLMKPVLGCYNETKENPMCPDSQTIECWSNQTEEVPLFYFLCFMAEVVDHKLTTCGQFENIHRVYMTMKNWSSAEEYTCIKEETDALVFRNLLVFSMVLNVLLPTLVWLYMRRKEKLYMEQKVHLDDVL